MFTFLFKKETIQNCILGLILVCFAVLVTYKITLPAAEDLPRQMMNGKDILAGNVDVLYKNVYSYTDPTHTFANHHWLYGVFAYALYLVGGFEGVVVFKVLLFVFLFWLLFTLSQKRAHFWLVALFSIPTLIMIMGRSAARPEMFSYVFTVIYLYFLSRFREYPDDKKIYALIPLQLLWANIHILFPAGVAIVGAFWVTEGVEKRKKIFQDKAFRILTVVLLAVTLISFVNPLGIKGVIYSLSANTIGATKVFSAEVQSIAAVFRTEPKSDYLGAFTFIPMVFVLAGAFLIGRKKRTIPLMILAGAFALLSFRIIRGVPMFAFVFLPAVTENLNDVFVRLISWLKQKNFSVANFCFWIAKFAFALLVILGTVFLRIKAAPYQVFGVGLTDTVNEPAEFLKENNISGPILNDTDIGSYLIWHFYPQEKVFADNRFADAYGKKFLEEEYVSLFNDEEAWNKLLLKYNFQVIVLNHYNKGGGMIDFIYKRVYDPRWVWVYMGRDVVIFVRNTPEHQEVIQKYAITQDNFFEKIKALSSAPDYRGQVAAADLFSYTGNVKASISQYERIVSQWPHLGKIWFLIGRNELLRSDQANSDSAQALLALKRAIKEGYKTPYSYSYLALAYYRLGDLDSAEKAVNKQLKIDPNSKDGNAWKDILLKERLRQLDADTL